MTTATIEVKNVQKTFGTFTALQDVSFTIQKGRDFWLSRTEWIRKNNND